MKRHDFFPRFLRMLQLEVASVGSVNQQAPPADWISQARIESGGCWGWLWVTTNGFSSLKDFFDGF